MVSNPWNERSSNAAERLLEVLKWSRENGCRWDELTCADAAENGHLEELKRCRKNGCPRDEQTCSDAAENGHWKY
jgi:hypothetical protein